MVFRQHNGILLAPFLLLPLFCTSGTACLRLDSSTAGPATPSPSSSPSDGYSAPSPSVSSTPTDSSSSSTSPSSACSSSSASPSNFPKDPEALDEDAYDPNGKLKLSCDWSKASCPGSKYSGAPAAGREGDSGSQRDSGGGAGGSVGGGSSSTGGEGGGVTGKQMPKGEGVREGRPRKDENMRETTTKVKLESSEVMADEVSQAVREKPKGGRAKSKPEKKETKVKVTTGNGYHEQEENRNKHENVRRKKQPMKEDKESKERQKRQTDKTVTKKQKKVESTKGIDQKKTDVKGKPVTAKTKTVGRGGGENEGKRKGARRVTDEFPKKILIKEEIRQEAVDNDEDEEHSENEYEGNGVGEEVKSLREKEGGGGGGGREGGNPPKIGRKGRISIGVQKEEERWSRTSQKERGDNGGTVDEERKKEGSPQGDIRHESVPSLKMRGRSARSRSNEVMEDEENEGEEEENEEKDLKSVLEDKEEEEEEKAGIDEEEEEEEEEEREVQEKEEEDEYEEEVEKNGPKKWRSEKMKLSPKKLKKYKKKNKIKNMGQQKRAGAKGSNDKHGVKINKKTGKKYEKKRKSPQKGSWETKRKIKVEDPSVNKGHTKHWSDKRDRNVRKKDEKKKWKTMVEVEEMGDGEEGEENTEDEDYIHWNKEEREDNDDEDEEVRENNNDIDNEDGNYIRGSKMENKRNQPHHRKQEEEEKEEEEEEDDYKEKSLTEEKISGGHKERVQSSKGNENTKTSGHMEVNGREGKVNSIKDSNVEHKNHNVKNFSTKKKIKENPRRRGKDNGVDVKEVDQTVTKEEEEKRMEENEMAENKITADKMEENKMEDWMKEKTLEKVDMTIESSVRLLKSEKELKEMLTVGSVQVIYVYNRDPDATATVAGFLAQLERASNQLRKYDIILARVNCEQLTLLAYCSAEEVNTVAYGFKEGKQRIAFPVDTLRDTNAIVASALHLSLVNAVPILQSSKERQELEGRCLGRYDIIFSYQTALGSYEHRVFLEVAYAFLDTYVFALTTYRAGALGLPDAPETDPETDPRHRSVMWILHCATRRPDEECVASPFYHRLSTHRLVRLFTVLQLPLWHALELTPSVKTISTPYDEHDLPLVLLMYDDGESADRVAALVAELALLFHGSVGLVTLDIRDTSASALASVRLNRRRIVTPAVAFFSRELETTKLLNDYDDAYEFVNNQLRALRELVPLTKEEEGYDPIYDPPELQQDDEVVLAMKPEAQLAAIPPITEEQAYKLIRQVSKGKKTKSKDPEGFSDPRKVLVIAFFLAWDPVSNMALQHLSVIPGAAEDLGLGVMVRRLDCYDWPGVCEAEDATTYPTVRFYTRGRNLTYTGPINSRHFLRSVLLLQEDLPRRLKSPGEVRYLLTLKGVPQGHRQLIPSVATGIFAAEEGAAAFISATRQLAPYQLSAIYIGKKAGQLCEEFLLAEGSDEDEDEDEDEDGDEAKESPEPEDCVVVSRPDDAIQNITVIRDSLGDESTLNFLIRHASINIMGELTSERYGALSLGDDSWINRALTLFILFVPEDKNYQDGEESSLKDGERHSGNLVTESERAKETIESVVGTIEEEEISGKGETGRMDGHKKKRESISGKKAQENEGCAKARSQKDLRKKGHKETSKSSISKDKNQVHTQKADVDISTPLCSAQEQKRGSTDFNSCSANRDEENKKEKLKEGEKGEEEQKTSKHAKEKDRLKAKGSRLDQKDKKKQKEDTNDRKKDNDGDSTDSDDDEDGSDGYNDEDEDDRDEGNNTDDDSVSKEHINNELLTEKERENKENKAEREETKEEQETQKDNSIEDDDGDDDANTDDDSDADITVLDSDEDKQEGGGEKDNKDADKDKESMEDSNRKNKKDKDNLHISSHDKKQKRLHVIPAHKSKTTNRKEKRIVKVEEEAEEEEEEDDGEDETDDTYESTQAATKNEKDEEDEVKNIREEIGRVFKEFHAPGIVFSWLNSKDQLGLDVLTAYGLPIDVPCLVALDVNQGQVRVYNEDLVPLKENSLRTWVDGVLKGTIKPSIELPQTEWAPPIPSIDFLHFIRQDQERDSQRQLLSEMETELGMQLQQELGNQKPDDYGET